MEMEKERQNVKQIKHEFHEHPLVFVGELSNQSREAYCTGCGEVTSGPCFSCSKCEYHLHKKCAKAPTELKHPLHPRHYRGLFLREGPSVCAFCKEESDMFFYECHNCWFALDINCALASNNHAENFHEFHHDAHLHSLTCIENLKYGLTRIPCSFCHQPLVDAVYICLKCPFHLHKKCLDELPTEINHPSHRIHPLFLNNTITLFCKFCQKKQYGSFYHCSPCNFSINIECAWPKPIIVEDKYHQHPFTLLLRQDSFICDACNIEGNFISYICSTCNIMVHKECILLPRIIKVTRHDHAIFHNYFLQKQELGKQDCNICFNEVKVERGSYYCLKQDCNFSVHVNCALENDDLYCVIDQEDQDEVLNENLAKEESSITSVTEVNEDGEVRKIKHFSHEHALTLDNKIEEDDDKLCDGCMVSISTSFYCCSQCEFILHKTCAELPRKKHHWFHRFVFTLDCKEIVFKCDFCDRLCSGFLYRNDRSADGNHFNVCLRCATIPKVLKCDKHKHFLFYDYNYEGQCNGCGVHRANGAYRCRECNFALDFACMTLPNAVQHKCDDHLLKLTYLEENNDIEQHYCDICEEKRDSEELWYYHCKTCDNSTHPKCALGKYPFVKDGITWPYWHPHRHDLIFVKNIDVDDYSSACYYCRKICQDQAFKCFTCSNYFRHLECLW